MHLLEKIGVTAVQRRLAWFAQQPTPQARPSGRWSDSRPRTNPQERLLVRAAGVEPARALRLYGFSYHFGFRRRLPAFVVWTIPSPWPGGCRRRPSSLYTFLRRLLRLGSGFPSDRVPRI